jgi:hypothetical protein
LTNTITLPNTNSVQKANIFKAKENYCTDWKGLSSTVNLTKGDNRNSGISLPKAIMARIDAVKHPDIPRSKFVLRILEAALLQQEQNYTK